MLKHIKYINTLDAHYDINRKECTFCFDNDIVEVVSDTLFDLDAEEEYSSKEPTMLIFKKIEIADDTHTASVKNMKLFRLLIIIFRWDRRFV